MCIRDSPSVIRESEVKKLVLFMDKKEQKVFTDNYTRLISEEATDDQLDAYPILKKENVYELKDCLLYTSQMQ